MLSKNKFYNVLRGVRLSMYVYKYQKKYINTQYKMVVLFPLFTKKKYEGKFILLGAY